MTSIIITILSMIYLVNASDFADRRCLLYEGQCVPHCPRHMHPYHSRCDGQTMSQRTCDANHVFVLGYTCGWSRCDCNGHMVLDEETGYCVELSDCAVKLSRRQKKKDFNRERRKKKQPFRSSRKFRKGQFEDPMETFMLHN